MREIVRRGSVLLAGAYCGKLGLSSVWEDAHESWSSYDRGNVILTEVLTVLDSCSTVALCGIMEYAFGTGNTGAANDILSSLSAPKTKVTFRYFRSYLLPPEFGSLGPLHTDILIRSGNERTLEILETAGVNAVTMWYRRLLNDAETTTWQNYIGYMDSKTINLLLIQAYRILVESVALLLSKGAKVNSIQIHNEWWLRTSLGIAACLQFQ